ncbi:replication initiator [Streptosporangium carneum]|uniref:replication initiator n=1 Tax=Streptosporangium carneum TaxID=47481 RepID=UPI0022F30A9C|nr:replication initiator [Streptosporangium carneum]
MGEEVGRELRAVRGARLLTREVAEQVAITNGVCIRPIPYRRVDSLTGVAEVVSVPCGATLESKCPPCAKRGRQVRRAQCREGWHLEAEPVAPAEASEHQRSLIEARAHLELQRDEAVHAGVDTAELDAVIDAVDREIQAAGMVGAVAGRSGGGRVRSTRRRQDAPDLPRRLRCDTTLGRTFTGSDGKVFRPSMFVTLTLPSYGRVRDGVPVDPGGYDYRRAARDALHFSKLIDRFVQNLRRVAGFDVQYFASVEPQRRLAPHLHIAIRGTLPRAELRQIVAATYHQVWWPAVDEVRFEGDRLPVWSAEIGGYVDSDTGEVLPTWDEALDRLDADQEADPLHVVRFGVQFDAQGVLVGSRDADQRVRYLTKYLTKSLGEDLGDDAGPRANAGRRAHAARLVEALRFEPCSPGCANWLRYGVQPKGAKSGMVPGRCRSKAHRAEHLGYAGRRVLVSRKWSGRTMGEHKRDRRAWVLEALGLDEGAADSCRFVWLRVAAGDPEAGSAALRLLREVARKQRWRAELERLRARADAAGGDGLGLGVRVCA